MKTPAVKRLLISTGLLISLAAMGAAAWLWRQATRPGRVHFERGLDYAAAKQIPQAEQEWLAGVREDPNFSDNQAQLGDLYAALRRFPEAAAQYKAATRLVPQDSSLFQRLEQAEDAKGDKQAALAAAERAAALRPQDAGAIGGYGIRAAALSLPTRALLPLKRAHALAPDNADYLIYLARVEFQIQDLAGAEHDLAPFLEHHPDNAEACYLMASVLHQKPQTADTTQAALGYARRAQAGAPGNADANILLGQILLDEEEPSRALPVFRQAQRLTPNSVTALHGLLTCNLLLGRPAQAMQIRGALNAALARRVQMGHASDLLLANPTDTTAMLEMARLREDNAEPALAESYYRQAVRNAPQNLRTHAALAGFLRRMHHSAEIPHTP